MSESPVEETYLHVLGAAVMGLATDVVLVVDAATMTLLLANRAFTLTLGYEPGEVAGLSLYDIRDAREIEANKPLLMAKGDMRTGIRSYRRKDGSLVEMDAAVTHMRADGREVFCVVAHDVTVLRENEERFRQLADAAFEGIAITDGDRVVNANSRMGELLRIAPEDLVGRSVSDFVAPESRETVAAHMRSGSERPYEHLAQRADGTVFPVEVQARPLVRGKRLRITAIRDVSERKNLEEQVRLAQRMESVGRLAGGVAHDFNNLLTVILSSVQFLNEAIQTPADREDLKQIEAAATRAAELTSQLLAFARRQVVELQIVDLNERALATERMLRRVIGEHIDLRSFYAEGVGKIRVDPGQVDQILMNLAVNARDAMPNGGQLTIETANVFLNEVEASAHPGVAPGQYVMLAVGDTGAGMDRGTLAHIFEPFFTTKVAGQGTGLGLATCYGIVKQAGGWIWVDSEPGKGTTFKVHFPRVRDVPVAAKPEPSATTRGSETLVVAEDDEMVRQVAVRVLRSQGYTVIEAARGAAAIQRFEELQGKVDLLITDVVMPEMSGKDLAEQLRARWPNLRVLFTSGYTEDTIVHHGAVDAGVNFLAKPYFPADLVRRVREALDKKP